MNRLKEQIAEFNAAKAESVSADILDIMGKATVDLRLLELEKKSLQTGDIVPDFTLADHSGVDTSLGGFLAESVVVINFYRGGWCPYCNMELRALQELLPEIERAGGRLVAISPEQPDHSLSTREKNELAFDILYDRGNVVAKTFGLLFELAEELRPIYESLGIDIPEYNGDSSFTLPVPATYIIGRDGKVLYRFVDADYTKRLEPREIVEQLQKISGRL